VLLDWLREEPRLASAKVVRDSVMRVARFVEVERVARGKTLKKPLMEIAASYSIETYLFSQAFLESGVSSSGYPSVLSRLKFEVEQGETVHSFIEIYNNFMQILYHTPEEISEQAILYVNTIADCLIDRQEADCSEGEVRSVLVEELFLRLITYYDSSRHKPLKRGILLSLAEFLMRRVVVEQELFYRVLAYLIKTESYQQEELASGFGLGLTGDSEARIDWKIKDTAAVRELLLSRGKFSVKVLDIANQALEVGVEVDELWTVGEMWQHCRNNLELFNDLAGITPDELDCYWLAGTRKSGENWDLAYLPSYEHLGKLIFEDCFERKFFIRRVLYPPHYHSLHYLRLLDYEELLGLFAHTRQNVRESASYAFLSDPVSLRVKLTVESIWIDALIEEEVTLAALRRLQDPESLSKYQAHREKIINDHLAQIYLKYLPVGTVLSEENRNVVVAELRGKKNEPVPKVMSEAIRERIVDFVGMAGVRAYTTKVGDSRGESIFCVNNRGFVFVDRRSSPHRTVSG
jgi:hypothetical protein